MHAKMARSGAGSLVGFLLEREATAAPRPSSCPIATNRIKTSRGIGRENGFHIIQLAVKQQEKKQTIPK